MLGANFSSFDAAQYGALLLIDPEEPSHRDEARKLLEDVTRRGLGLVVAADWHDPALLRQARPRTTSPSPSRPYLPRPPPRPPRQLRYVDEHTNVDHVCGSGGANVPALNRLLQPLGIAFRSAALHGPVSLGARPFDYLSGTALAALPAGALAHFASLSRVSSLRRPSPQAKSDASRVAVLGLHQPKGAAAGWVTRGRPPRSLSPQP